MELWLGRNFRYFWYLYLLLLATDLKPVAQDRKAIQAKFRMMGSQEKKSIVFCARRGSHLCETLQNVILLVPSWTWSGQMFGLRPPPIFALAVGIRKRNVNSSSDVYIFVGLTRNDRMCYFSENVLQIIIN